ncbi:cupin domain-containing protein [Hathewaya massiliensis]|uniref:cupin domain-containing protein n=1 Tax=Hathewaya massiliensis TaxID=1964382 RepID=UPI0011585D5F|nr:cupin domain-containing protein [Hathewaya massiliensis]
MIKSAEYFIKNLNMKPHAEGGYYRECFISNENISIPLDTLNLNEKEKNLERTLWSSIYFLLQNGEVSHFHRLQSDEIWYYHGGSPLTIYIISPEGQLTKKFLGLDIENGEAPQVLVPKNYIFGSAMNHDGYSLVGCMVSPGFHFDDFELLKREDLLKMYPDYRYIINKLTRD